MKQGRACWARCPNQLSLVAEGLGGCVPPVPSWPRSSEEHQHGGGCLPLAPLFPVLVSHSFVHWPRSQGNRRPFLRGQHSGTARFQGRLSHNTACITRGRGEGGAESERSLLEALSFSIKNILRGILLFFLLLQMPTSHFFSFRSRKGQQTFP